MNGTRRVVLWVPDWPTTSLVVDTPPDSAAAVVHRGRVDVCTARARRAGVRRGMPTRTAQYLCPELVLLPRDPLREAAAFEVVAQAFDALAANVTCLRPGLAWAPAAGPARWIGSEDLLAESLVDEVSRTCGAECQVGVARGVLAGIEAAHRGLVVPDADTTAFLAALDLEDLRPLLPLVTRRETEDTLDVLRELGVTTCGDLVALGRSPLLTRFGATGEALWDLCTGGDPGTRSSRRAPDEIEVTAAFDPPALELDQMVIGLRALAEDLARRLWHRGLTSRTLGVWMRTEAGTGRERTWAGVECSDVAEVVDRLRWQLRAWTDAMQGAPDSGLAEVGLVAHDLDAAPPGATLWGRSDAQVRATRAALRLQSLLGEDAVLTPRLQGGHDPRSRVHEAVWGTPSPPLPTLQGEWEGALEEAPSTILEVPLPVELWGRPRDAGGTSPGPGTAGGRPLPSPTLGLVASHGRRLSDPDPGAGDPSLVPVHVDGRGSLDAVPHVLRPLPALVDVRLPQGLDAGVGTRVWVTGGPWPVRGRWWEGPGPRSPRAYLRLGREEGPDLLLVQRAGTWALEGIHD